MLVWCVSTTIIRTFFRQEEDDLPFVHVLRSIDKGDGNTALFPFESLFWRSSHTVR